MHETTNGTWPNKWTQITLGLLSLLALAEFSVRGPARALRQSTFNDFVSPYIQSQAWMRGQDPYNSQVVAALWPVEADRPMFLLPESRDGTLPAKRGIPSPYPITALPLLMPFALLPWQVSILLWTVCNTIAFATVVRCVLALARTETRSIEGLLIILSALVLAPFHTAIATANIVVIVFALGMLAAIKLEGNRYISAGMLLAAAAALKPTVALCFFLYSIVRGRWRVVAITLAGLALLFAVADLRLLAAGIGWIHSYVLNTQRMFASGAIDDYSAANPNRFDLLNLQVIAFQMVGSKIWTEIISWFAVCGLSAFWILLWRKNEEQEGEKHNGKNQNNLIDLAILATISLLPFYHRFTDGCLLFPGIAWSITELNRSRQLLARMALISSAAFLLPGAAILQSLAASSAKVGYLSRTWWWQLFVAPHQVWIVLAISVLLLAARWEGNTNNEEVRRAEATR